MRPGVRALSVRLEGLVDSDPGGPAQVCFNSFIHSLAHFIKQVCFFVRGGGEGVVRKFPAPSLKMLFIVVKAS